MTPGALVEVVSGPWIGRHGVIDCVMPEGVAVSLRVGAGHVRHVVIVRRRELRRLTPAGSEYTEGASLGNQVVESWSARAADGERASARQGVLPASATAPATQAVPGTTATNRADPADGRSVAASGDKRRAA